MPTSTVPATAWRHLVFATISFTLCFAAWGLISAFAPEFRAELQLSAQATALLVAVPVLLGAVARLPMGMLTDRFGGRLMFTLLFVAVAVAVALVPFARSYNQLLAFGFLVGLAGSSFAIGVGFASRWFPAATQGTALGIYGLGNMGHSAAVFLGPVAAGWGVDESEIPGAGLSAVEIMEAIHRGEIKALFSMCFNPLVSLPDSAFTREALSKLEFFGVIDFFMSETAHHADVIFAGSLHEEDEGVICSAEGRVQKINKAVDPPGDARSDARIICDLARKLGRGEYFDFPSTREIYEELRRASQGGLADYYGITWERIDQELGVFWPCPALDHPGTPRLFEGGRFYHPDGKAHFQITEWRPAGDPVDAEYPILLTTGRVVSHYLSGTQTRRIGPLVDQCPEPKLEIHPTLAARLGIADSDWVKVTTRRSELVVEALIVRTIRPDTVFVPYHWPGRRSANRLTHRTLDPRSKIPEYKVSACRLEKTTPPTGAEVAAMRREETGWGGGTPPVPAGRKDR